MSRIPVNIPVILVAGWVLVGVAVWRLWRWAR